MRNVSFTAAVAAAALLASACSESLPTEPGADLNPSYVNGTAAAAGNKLQCFDGETEGGPDNTGQCELISDGAHIVTGTGTSYAGVYINNSNLDGKSLADINKLAFSWEGSTTLGGSPRITFPIDLDGDGGWDDFVSADALGCSTGTATSGTVDLINNPDCLISLNSGGTYTGWAAFLAAFPDAHVATDAISFIIVDQPGDFTITNVQLGKGPAKSRP